MKNHKAILRYRLHEGIWQEKSFYPGARRVLVASLVATMSSATSKWGLRGGGHTNLYDINFHYYDAPITDAEPEPEYGEAVVASQAGIVEGYGDGTHRSFNDVYRGEFVTMNDSCAQPWASLDEDAAPLTFWRLTPKATYEPEMKSPARKSRSYWSRHWGLSPLRAPQTFSMTRSSATGSATSMPWWTPATSRGMPMERLALPAPSPELRQPF